MNGREYRIDELAHTAGTTVRNIRAYQDRGLLPPPRRVGRVGPAPARRPPARAGTHRAEHR
ncbi:MerR family transcriptional regulator [Pseudonocardia petroleophila]|uniref:MerR family transcriptional regulator n=1 Tax=Pseudonocardia petroleophila TaxID=37331 RepID=UPI001C8C3174